MGGQAHVSHRERIEADTDVVVSPRFEERIACEHAWRNGGRQDPADSDDDSEQLVGDAQVHSWIRDPTQREAQKAVKLEGVTGELVGSQVVVSLRFAQEVLALHLDFGNVLLASLVVPCSPGAPPALDDPCSYLPLLLRHLAAST